MERRNEDFYEALIAGFTADKGQEDEVPLDLQIVMGRAFDLEELNQVGAVFPYPDSLPPIEWLALRALQAARRLQEKKELEERELAAKIAEKESQFQQIMAAGTRR